MWKQNIGHGVTSLEKKDMPILYIDIKRNKIMLLTTSYLTIKIEWQ